METGSASQLRDAMIALCDPARREPMIGRCAAKAGMLRLDVFVERQLGVYRAVLAWRRSSADRFGALRR